MSKKICIVDSDFAHKRIDISRYLKNDGFDVTILGSSKDKFPDDINYVHYNLNRYFSFLSLTSECCNK